MSRSLPICALAGAVLLSACGSNSDPGTPAPKQVDLLSAVDPMIGTGGVGFGVGSAYPGAAVPFAMIHPSPDSRNASSPGADFYHCSGYYYDDKFIGGFSLLHFYGTGANDYGVVSFMPVDGMSDDKTTADGYDAGFKHEDETATPGYYSVKLATGIQVEITASLRAATFRFTFPDAADPVVLLDLGHNLGSGRTTAGDVAIDAGTGELSSHMHKMGGMSGGFGGFDAYAEAAFDVAPTAIGTWDDSGRHAGQASASATAPADGAVSVGGWLEFPKGTTTVTMRTAVSFVDGDGAKKNLAAEAPTIDFDGMRAAATQTWKDEFSRVEVYGANDYDTTLTATAFYHTLLMPTLMSDVDGRVVAVDASIIKTNRSRYSDFSLWDTYRTLHPWFLLAEDKRNADFAASLVAMGQEGGAVPKWAVAHGDAHSMVGSPGEIVLAESAQKGVPFDDENAAYSVARVAAFGDSPGPCGGRGDMTDYLKYGFVPATRADGSTNGGSVSDTQEYAVADAALAAWATKLGKSDDAKLLAAHAQGYKQLYDPDMGFFRGKKPDGSWTTWPGETKMADDYVEGDAWHYLWMVPQDPDALAEVLGGKDAALARLRDFFQASKDESPVLGVRFHYWQSNEPDIHVPWLLSAWGSRADTARINDWILTTLYTIGPDGIPGNDDGGTMSAWVLLADAGVYPVNGTDRYIVGSPRFPLMVIHRPSGDLRIEATPAPAPGRVPASVSLDGQPLDGPYVTHAQLSGDHVLSFKMTHG